MTTTRLTIQPIHFTAQAHLWREFYRKLGLNRITGDDDLVEIWVAGSGLIVLAEVEGDRRWSRSPRPLWAHPADRLGQRRLDRPDRQRSLRVS